MSNPHPEFASNPSSLETRFTGLIDAKFAQGQPRASWREHEEELSLLAVRPLSICPTASGFRLKRPILEETELAQAKWEQFGGHLVKVLEASQGSGLTTLESDFFAIGDTMYWRKVHIAPGESIMVPPEPLNDSQAHELWEWVETGMMEP